MRQIFIFSVIDSWLAEDVVRRLLAYDRESEDEITIFLNSPGGSVLHMFGIIDTIRVIKSPVRTVVVGMAASAAAVIASSGKPRLVMPSAQILLHEASAGTMGTVSDMRETLGQIEKLNAQMVSVLAKNTGRPKSEISETIKKTDKYFSASEAISYGLADRILSDGEAQAFKLSESINVEVFEFSSERKEVQLLREGKYNHPVYGRVVITEDILNSMKKNFDSGARGQDISIDYTHENEDGEAPAAFWIKSLEIKSNFDGNGKGLFAHGEFTPRGAKKVSEKEYRYASADFVIDYVAQDGKHYPYVLRGGTLTNRPFIKNMNPIKLSEPKEKSVMDKNELIASLKDHGIDVEAVMSSSEAMSARVRDLEEKIVELGKLPVAKEEEIAVLRGKLAEANNKIVFEAKEKAFDSLVAEGKVVPAQKEVILATFKASDEILAFYKDSPKVVAMSPKGGSSASESEALSDEELKLVALGEFTKEEIIENRVRA